MINMIFWEIAKKDFKVVMSSRIKRLSLLVVLLMPLAYGFLYLWASWDPYANMKDIPVAVVNDDSGAIFKGKTEKYGEKIVTKMKENEVVEWNFVDYQTAISGLDSQKYYAIVHIPKNFSTSIVSASGDNPVQAKIEWQTKDSTSYLFTRYFEAVITELEKKINKEVASSFQTEAEGEAQNLVAQLDQASNGAASLASGLETISSGSKTLSENLAKVDTGASNLTNGLGVLNGKSYDLQRGVSEVQSGAASLRTGLSSARSGADSLDSGLSSLYSGSADLKDGTHQAYQGASTLAYGTAQMADKINTANETLEPVYTSLDKVSNFIDEINGLGLGTTTNYIAAAKTKKNQLVTGQNDIAAGAKNLASGLSTLDSGASSLNTGILSAERGANTLTDGISDLYDGSSDLYDGLGSLYDGSQKFSEGIGEAYDGSSLLNSGTKQLAAGSNDLTAGINKAKDGANLLTRKLSDGATEIEDKLSAAKIDGLITVINEPVIMENVSVDTNETYGSALAPYFISLALWMGALMLALLIPTRDQQLVVNNISRRDIVLGKMILPAAVGIIQSGLLTLAVVAGLGLKAKYLLPLILFCILTSFCFSSIMQFLSFSLDKIGELVGILLLLLQLTSSSGTFPVKSSPRIFRILNPLVPMNYSIKGMRLLILGGISGIIWQQALVLAGMMLLFIILKALLTRTTVFSTDIYPIIKL